jgi:hypothetical protein
MQVSGQLHASASFPRGRTLVPIWSEAGWVPEPVWARRLKEKSLTPADNRTPVIQPAASHCSDLAAPAPTLILYIFISENG